jgi:proteasome lid subunit RPN8/RPN11
MNQDVFDALLHHARKEAPLEACGYLAEKEGLVIKNYELTNMDKSAVHFSFDPKEQFECAREIRSKGQKLRAVYHSHPATPARMSGEDIKLAVDPALSYVIISLLENEIKSFIKQKSSLKPEEISLLKETRAEKANGGIK